MEECPARFVPSDGRQGDAMKDAERDQARTTEALKDAARRRPLTPAAQRALAEAAERRALAATIAPDKPPELQGPKGPEPTRYGDWERNGIASDF
jgi:hypothetical protein